MATLLAFLFMKPFIFKRHEILVLQDHLTKEGDEVAEQNQK